VYLPALDGLRAVAVGAVFLFHSGVVSGGFIGVDVFFVISGFLITGLAVAEVERTDRLSIGGFWARRARRLLPALLVVVAAVLVVSIAEGGAALRRVGRDVASTILYVANWAQIGEGRDYFATYEAPPLLEHAWSLAVEEQFYIVWPIVIAGLAWACRGRQVRFRTIVASVGVAVAIASLLTALILRSDDGVSLSRLYYGTDTRAVGLAIGAVAGALIHHDHLMSLQRRSLARDVAGIVAAIALIAIAVTIDGSERWLYGPGFLLIAVLSLVVMYAAMGAGALGSWLSLRALVVVGTMSYGIYLWHWPVIVVLDRDRTGLSGPALGVLWVTVTAMLATASWFVIERRAPIPTRKRPQRALAYTTVALVLAFGAVVLSNRATETVRAVAYTVPAPLTVPPAAPVAPSDGTTATSVAPSAGVSPTPVRLFPEGRALRLLIVGDSVADSLRGEDDTERYQVDAFGEVEVMNVGGIACSVIHEGVWWLSDGTNLVDNPGCDGPERYDRVIADFEPDVVLALFAWPGMGAGQQLDDGSVVQPCEPGFDERWLRDYRAMVERIEQNTVAVVSTVAPPTLPRAEQGPGTACLNALVDQIDAPQFDYQEWLCPGYDCGSSTLRTDGVHFRNTGQLQRDVMQAIVPQVVSAAGY
jgi:peptidoglycan/LPS O-acetylase OafA/YrhL